MSYRDSTQREGKSSHSPLRSQASPMRDTQEMQSQLSALNKQMDDVEYKCRELNAAAKRKELMEDTEKQLAYMHLVNKNDYLRNKEAWEASQQLPPLPSLSDWTSPLQESPSPNKNYFYGNSGGPLNTEMQQVSPQKETFGNNQREDSPEEKGLRSGQSLNGLGSKKVNKKQLKTEIKQEVAQLRETLQQYESERAILKDDAYLQMLKSQLNSDETEDRIQISPIKEKENSLPATYEQNSKLERSPVQEDYIYTSPINNPLTESRQGNSYYAKTPEKVVYQEREDQSAVMNYAETIKSIRKQRQEEYEQSLQVVQDRKAATNNLIGGEKGRQEIYDYYIKKPTKGQMTHYKQHDEFAAVNFLDKVSKYDLDRGHLNYKGIWREKQERRHTNANNKRGEIDRAVYIERYNDVVDKIQHIRQLNNFKTSKLEARKKTALDQQMELSRYIAEKNSMTADPRPLVYTSDQQTTSFKRSSPMKTGNNDVSYIEESQPQRSQMFNQSSMYIQRTIPEEDEEEVRPRKQNPFSPQNQLHAKLLTT